MKLKHYLLIILFPIFIIFAFSPIVFAEDVEESGTKTEAPVETIVKNEENTECKEKPEENEENIKTAEEKNIPQVKAKTNSPTKETEEIIEKNELKSEKIENKEKLRNEQPDPTKNKDSNYVVEFIHNKLKYILPGDNSVKLSKILDKLEITGSEITEVKSSNDSLFSATKESGEWVVNSHKAFHTNEHLYVTVDNRKYDIKATDYSLPGNRWQWHDSNHTIARTINRIDQNNTSVQGTEIYGYYYYETRTLKITGFGGELQDYSEKGSPMWNMCGDINIETGNYVDHIEMDDTITYIGNNFFFGVNRDSSHSILKRGFTIHLPTSLTEIGNYAFQHSGISAAYIPDGVTTIGQKAFDNCPELAAVLIPNTISTIGTNAFSNTSIGETITIDNDRYLLPVLHVYAGTTAQNLFPACGGGGQSDFNNRFPNYQGQYFHWYGEKIGATVYAFPKHTDQRKGLNYDDTSGHTYYSLGRGPQLEIVGYGSTYNYDTSSNPSPIKTNISGVATTVTFSTSFGKSENGLYDRAISSIGEYLFYSCGLIRSVTLPAPLDDNSGFEYRLTSIGKGAFQGCSALTSIKPGEASGENGSNTFPSYITIINESVFNGCTSLKSFTVNIYTTSISERAFYGCTALETVMLPNTTNTTLTSIGNKAFQGCIRLTTIEPIDSSVNTFPNGITTISIDTFWGCSELASFTISSKITTIGGGAFGQTGLTSITIPTNVVAITDPPLDNNQGGIPRTDWGAFAGCTALQSITFASGRTDDLTLGRGAFYNTRAASIVFPEKLTTIGIGAFQSCTNLNSVTFPTSTLTTVGAEAFKGCSSLTDLTIPTSISSGGLGANAFANIKNKADIYYSGTESDFASKCSASSTQGVSNVANVFGYDLESTATNSYIYHFPCGANLWYGLDGATAKITITGSGDMTDYTYNNTAPSPIRAHCTSSKPFTTIDMQAGTSIGAYALYNCASVTTVILRSGNLSTIGKGAFENCTNLVTINPTGNSSNNNTFPSNVSVINESVLRNCTSLSEFTISSFASSIGRYAFYGDTSLTSITIPASVGSIDESAFQNCSNLTSVTILSLAPTMSVNAFAGLSTNADIWYMYGTKEEFLTKCEGNALSGASTPFGTNSYVFHFLKSGGPDYKCGDNLYWRVEYDYNNNADTTVRNTTFYVTKSGAGSGTFEDKAANNRSWYNSTISPTVTKLVVEGATTIGKNAFYNFTGLTSITLPSTLEEIKYSAFGHTAITSITIPANVTTIGDYHTSDDYGAFQGCTSLKTVTFANNSSLTSIGSETFKGCTTLDTITIPGSVTTIMNEAFYGCSSLTNVTIPTTISSAGLGANAFANIKNKADIYYSGTESDFASKCSASSAQSVSNVANVFGYDIESNDANSYIYHFPCGASLWYGLDGATATITITGSGSMYTYWFSNDNYSGYAEFGLSPFNSHCASGNTFTTIDMQAGTSIGTYAFYECASIATITLHTAIGTNALDSIGQGAFRECTNLTSIKPSGSDVDDPNTFPGSVTTMRRDTFWLCTKLTSFTIPSSVTNIEGGTFGNSGLTSINIPTTVTTIENPSLDYDTWGAFAQCSSLAEITFSTGRTTNLIIGQGAFYGAAVTSVTIPNKVTIIGKGAFLNCSSLATVNFEGAVSGTTYSNDITSIGQNAFAGLNANANVWYRYGDKASLIAKCYDTNTLDSSFGASNKYIYHFSIDHGPCGPALDWEVWNTYQYVDGTNDIDKNEMTISGSGDFYDGVYSGDIIYGDNNRPWAAYAASVTDLTVKTGATNIGHDAFQGFAALSSVTFESPQTVTAIQYDAFNGCTNLSSITLPSTLTTIGHSAFVYTGLTSITIPASVTNLGVTTTQKIIHNTDGTYSNYSDNEDNKKIGPFYNCDSLARVTFAGTPSVTYIGIGCFRSCEALTSITIPQTVTTIYENAFIYCSALIGDTPTANQLTIPAAVTQIKNNAFSQCENLKSVVFSSGSRLTSIGNYAFQKCTGVNFNVVNLPEGLTSVGTYAFQNCPNLNEVRIPLTISSSGLEKSAFANLASKANIYYNGTENDFASKCSASSTQGVSNVKNVFGYDIAGTDANNYIYHFKCGPCVWYSLDATSGTKLEVNIYKNVNNVPQEEVPTTIGTYDWNNGNNRSPFYSHGGPSGLGLPMYVLVDYDIDYLGDSIFQDCLDLLELNLPLSLDSTGTNICNRCSNLERVVGSGTAVTVIQPGSFKDCSKLGTMVSIISANNNITTIGNEAFSGCSSLNVNIPNSVTAINNYAFFNCSKLASITIPTGVTSVGSNAFVGLGTDSSVTKVDITYSGKEAALTAKCSGGTLTGSFGCEAINDGKYTFHFTQDITYYSNGSQITDATPDSYITASSETQPLSLYTPALPQDPAVRFMGWCTDVELETTPIDSIIPAKSGPYGDLVYYAKWIIERNINYVTNGGGFDGTPVTVFTAMTNATITLSIPTKIDNAFLGWHFLSDLSDNAVGSFVADNPHNHDITVYAEWYQRENIPYWANSNQTLLSSVDYEIVKPWETTLGTPNTTTWYVLDSDVSFDDRLIINGNVHLILKDGCTITSYGGISVNEGNSITIYAQDSDQNYINQDYSSVDELITKMNLQHIEMTNTFNGVTYGAEDNYYEKQIVNLSNGNVYTPDYDIDYGKRFSYSDGSTTLVFGGSAWNNDEGYFTVDGGVTKYYKYYDDIQDKYYVTADEGVTKYYFVEYTIKCINTENKNDSFWTLDIEPSQDETGRYIVPCNDTTKYYIYHDSALNMYYVSADEGATKYYNAYQYTKWICNNHDADEVWIDNDDFYQNWTSLGQDYYLDTDTLKTYYQEYEDDKDYCSYYYETTDTEKTHKYYETSLNSSRLFTDDIDAYNSRISSLNIPGALKSITHSGTYAVIGGDNEHVNGNITIYGGNYMLTNSTYGAAIGTGSFEYAEDPAPPNNSTITIHGGNIGIVPTSSDAGNAIGGGYNANGGNIIINGGRLEVGYNQSNYSDFNNDNNIGSGRGISAAEDTTTVRISWTNITDLIAIKSGAIRCSQLTFEDENGNPKKFVLAGENKLTENSYVTPEMIATMGDDSDFILIPYSEDIQYVLQIPARTVVPFRTTNRKLSYDPEHNSPTVSVQTKPDDLSTPNVDESTPLVKPYQLILTMSKTNFRRITGTDAQDNPIFSDQDVIVYDLVGENNHSIVEIGKYFSSDSYDYDRYQPTDLGGSENAWINIESNQWHNLTPGIYQGLVTFEVGLATNGAKPGEVPFYFYYLLGG